MNKVKIKHTVLSTKSSRVHRYYHCRSRRWMVRLLGRQALKRHPGRFGESECTQNHILNRMFPTPPHRPSEMGRVETRQTYVLFHRISHGLWHHDAAEDGHENEVECVHEASAPGLSDLGAAAAAQGATSRPTAASQLEKKHRTSSSSHCFTNLFNTSLPQVDLSGYHFSEPSCPQNMQEQQFSVWTKLSPELVWGCF